MKTLNFLCLVSIAGLLASCYPKGPDTVTDLDIVVTTYDDTYDFKAQNTYAIPDKIVNGITISQGDTTYEYVSLSVGNSILAEINDQMSSYGWTQVDIDANPDMLFMPGVITTTNYFYSDWYNWWYSDFYYWNWYYPPYYTASSYTTGSLIMVLANPNEADLINASEAKWVGVCNGILSSSGNVSVVTNAVAQAFAQSEYLDQN
jgi:hypothetical protein